MEYKILNKNEIVLMKEITIEGFNQFKKESFEDFINTPNTYAFIAKNHNSVVGLCYGYVLKRPDREDFNFYIRSLGVLESFRKRGIGSALLEFVKSYAFEKLNCSECFLTTINDNGSACRLYEKHGGETYEKEIVYKFTKPAKLSG